jgi:phytoene/squalene synthetase
VGKDGFILTIDVGRNDFLHGLAGRQVERAIRHSMVQYSRITIFFQTLKGLELFMEPGTLSIVVIVFVISGLAALIAAIFFRLRRRDEDFYRSEKVVFSVSPTFHEAIGKVRGERHRHVLYALDAITGKIDQLVNHKDDPMGLAAFEKALIESIEKRRVNQPVLKSLQHIRRRLGKDYDFLEFLVMIDARKRDFEHKGFQTLDELYAYGDDIHGARIAALVKPFVRTYDEKTKRCVETLGRAMTMTRTLRMIGDDYRMERIYVPRNAMTKARYLSYELRHATINDSFVKLFEDLAKQAEADFNEVLLHITCFPKALRKMITYIVVIEKNRIEACRKDDYEVFYQNHELDRETREAIYRSYLKHRIGRKAKKTA